MVKVAVLVPCYNEELTIAKVIKDCKKYLPEADVYVCDNNSTDKTIEVAKKETNEVLIHSTMALIEFEIQYCLTEKKSLSPELQRAKDDLQSYLSRK